MEGFEIRMGDVITIEGWDGLHLVSMVEQLVPGESFVPLVIRTVPIRDSADADRKRGRFSRFSQRRGGR